MMTPHTRARETRAFRMADGARRGLPEDLS